MPVTSAAAVVAAIVTIVPRPSAPGPHGRGGGDRISRAVGELLRLALAVVGIDDLLRLASDRLDQPRSIVVEASAAAVILADDAAAILASSLGQMAGDGLPLLEIGGDEPVDQLPHLALDLLRCVADDLLLEPLLHRGCD